MSNLVRDTAIALRFAPHSNSSRFVVWFGREQGRFVTLIRGAQRPKSFFLGQCDLFATSDIVFYRHPRHPVHLARECALVRARPVLRRDWRAAAAASYASDLLQRSLPREEPHPRLYNVVSDWLDTLGSPRPVEPDLCWFELAYLAAEGLAPRLQGCVACGAALDAGRPARFVTGRGGFLCGRCDTGPAGSRTFRLGPADLAVLRSWQAAERPRRLDASGVPPETVRRIADLLGDFLRHHLNLPLPSRDLAFEIIRFRPSRAALSPNAGATKIAMGGRVAESADAQDLGSCGVIRGGSSPPSPTNPVAENMRPTETADDRYDPDQPVA